MPNLKNQVSGSAIAFIDTQVENYQSLIAGVTPGTEVVVHTPDAAFTGPIVIDPSSTATPNSDYTFSPTSITFPADTTKNTTLTMMADNGQHSSLSPYEIDLKTGTITGGLNQFISLVNTPTDSNADSWLEAVAKINFDGNIKKAKFIVEYDDTPSGWTVNIGDSASNNGYGGDGGTQSRDAEMQIINGNMSVNGNDYNTPAGAQLTQGNVPNLVSNGSRVELEVSNEKLAWDNKSGLQNSLTSPYLYALNGQHDDEGPVNSEMYAGFNRVISGPGARIGSGASKVTIMLNPLDYAISAGTATVTEGNSGETAMAFTVTRSGCTELESQVDYAIDGTAEGSDYHNIGGTSGATGATGTIKFAAGETSKTITLDVLGDVAIEPDETVNVRLSNPSRLDSTPTITTATATTTITNDDILTGDSGSSGDDALFEGKGDDLLNGGLGMHTLTEGMGVDKFLLSTNSGTNTITNFEVGKDLLVLGNGLSFSQVAIAQDSGATLIRFAPTGEILASLPGVSANSISAENFGLM